jgi:hypothetical protein
MYALHIVCDLLSVPPPPELTFNEQAFGTPLHRALPHQQVTPPLLPKHHHAHGAKNHSGEHSGASSLESTPELRHTMHHTAGGYAYTKRQASEVESSQGQHQHGSCTPLLIPQQHCAGRATGDYGLGTSQGSGSSIGAELSDDFDYSHHVPMMRPSPLQRPQDAHTCMEPLSSHATALGMEPLSSHATALGMAGLLERDRGGDVDAQQTRGDAERLQDKAEAYARSWSAHELRGGREGHAEREMHGRVMSGAREDGGESTRPRTAKDTCAHTQWQVCVLCSRVCPVDCFLYVRGASARDDVCEYECTYKQMCMCVS